MKKIIMALVILTGAFLLTNCNDLIGGGFEEKKPKSGEKLIAKNAESKLAGSREGVVNCTNSSGEKMEFHLQKSVGGQKLLGQYVCTLDVKETSKNPDWNAVYDINYCKKVLVSEVQDKEALGWTCSGL